MIVSEAGATASENDPEGATARRAFPHRVAGHCGSGTLCDLPELHGLDPAGGPPSEGFVFGVAGALRFLCLEHEGVERTARWAEVVA